MDYGVRIVAVFGLSIPGFIILTCMLVFPAIWWSYTPPYGATRFFDAPLENRRLFVPATLALAVGTSAGLMRLTRSAFLEVLRQDYVRTARAKGLRARTVVPRHAFRNAPLPILTLMGLQRGTLLGGSVILEQVLGLPGIGFWSLTAIQAKDYPIIMAVTMYAALTIVLITLFIDLLYGVVDPRVRLT